jgi:alkanesulfonate monooxygenase SsuD/methylene tetrahydromethanopterin reductase-like flavin-dependent oxidoreductase (luciferase family)
MRYGVLILPDERWSDARERWQLAERLGFDHAWTYDHLTWRQLRNDPWFSAVPTLAAAAMITSTIRLGTLVASPNFRHPLPFAKELMTLDDLSGGRLTLGFGAGADGFDASATRSHSWSPGERQGRFEEFVTVLDQILTRERCNHSGRYYLVSEARSIPGCIQQPRIPFALAATGKRGMGVVARFAGTWVSVDSRGPLQPQLELLEESCIRIGRDPASVHRLRLLGHQVNPLASSGAFADVAGELAEQGFSDMVVHWPRRKPPFAANLETLERIAGQYLPVRPTRS